MALTINPQIEIPDEEIELNPIRAQGAGGQNVNKVSSAMHLRFDIPASSLPEEIKARLLQHNDQRISKEGVVVIKAQQFRTQEKNREAALLRLQQLILCATVTAPPRRPTRPTLGSKQKRLEGKTQRGKIKDLRKKIPPEQ